jgi:hypothetical protein
MLRITTSNFENTRSMKIEGRVIGPWVAELKKAWLESALRAQGKPIRVDLRAVSFADTEGRDLLLKMREEGAVLIGPSAYIHQVLERAAAESRQARGNRQEA